MLSLKIGQGLYSRATKMFIPRLKDLPFSVLFKGSLEESLGGHLGLNTVLST